MEITEKQKKLIGIGVSVGVVGVACAGLYYYYLKPTKELDNLDKIHNRVLDPYDELGYDKLEQMRMPKLTGDSRWRNIDAKYEDLDNLNNRNRRRDRFTIFNRSGDITNKRFKILETHGDKGEVVRGTGRFRVSGNVHKPTPSGYNKNNRNANFNDLIL